MQTADVVRGWISLVCRMRMKHAQVKIISVLCTLRMSTRESGPMPLYTTPMLGVSSDIFCTVVSSTRIDGTCSRLQMKRLEPHANAIRPAAGICCNGNEMHRQTPRRRKCRCSPSALWL